ncbi:MAG: AAA family ATPase [Alphaproteobacteria bacterium]
MIYRLVIDAFVLTQDFEAALTKAGTDHLLSRSQITVHPGGLAAAAEHYADSVTPALLIVEGGDDDGAILGDLARLADVCAPNTKVIVAARRNDIHLYRTLLGQGVSDYLVLPLKPTRIVEAIDAIFAEPGAAPRGRLIAFFGVRGGVGSSTVASNTAYAITRAYQDNVVLVDFDLLFGTSALAFNLAPPQTLADALKEPDRIDATLIERIMAKHDDRLKVLPAPGGLSAKAVLSPDVCERVVEIIRLLAPYVVVDLPPSWEPWVQHLLVTADAAVVTVAPDLACLREAKAVGDYLGQKRGEETPALFVLNRVGAYPKGELGARDFGETLGNPPVLTVSYDPALFVGAFNNGQMVGEVPKGAKVADGFRQLAVKVGGRPPPTARRQDPMPKWLKDLIGGHGSKKKT